MALQAGEFSFYDGRSDLEGGATNRHGDLFSDPEVAANDAQPYRSELAVHGLVGSMGRRGNPYDKGKAESFMKTLKCEEVYLSDYQSFEEVVARLPLGLILRRAPLAAKKTQNMRRGYRDK